ncbi:MAG: hypothetical protein JHC95_11255 [Solirubrobacteraceae bacterium]|nr:hypothetical protein [Solirubrobacteraceae bacterium]
MASSDFKLPEGWYRATVSDLVDHTLPPKLGPLTPENAWKYVYACALWSEHKEGREYLHLNDRLESKAGRQLAERGLEWMRDHFIPSADPFAEINLIGMAYQAERDRQGSKKKWQRNNITGRSFEVVLQELIERLCKVRPAREPQLRTLSGFELAPPGYHSQPDLALFGPRDFRLLISTKWTLRKERIGTYLHEAYYYRQRRSDLQIAFVVNEYNINIIEWLVADPLVDRVYHANLPMLLGVHSPFDGKATVATKDLLAPTKTRKRYERWLAVGSKLHDLSELFTDIDRLNTQTARLDPADEGSGEDEGGETDDLTL